MRKLLFFDDFLVNRQTRIERRWQQPDWLAERAFCDTDTAFGCGMSSVVPAPAGGYLLYYAAMTGGGNSPDDSTVVCLAHSDDGLDWRKHHFSPPRKPGYPQVVYPGSPIPTGTHVYHDPDDLDATRRYKMTDCSHRAPHRGRMLYSADGLDWRLDDEHPFLDWQADTQLHLLRNARTGRYQMHLRMACGDRRVFRIESADLRVWTRPQLVLHPGPLDPPMRHFYGMPQFRYGDLYLGFLWCYQTVDEAKLFKHVGVVETELVYSYDGLTWNRTHRLFMPRRAPGEYGGGSMYGAALLDRGDSLLLYAVGSLEEHHRALGRTPQDPPFNVLLPGCLRPDGFVCLAPSAGTGELTTDLLYPRSPELSLNLRAIAGRVQVQICDPDCQPLPGYTFDDCAVIQGDGTALTPQWREHHDLTGAIASARGGGHWLAGWIRIQIRLELAELYSINGDFGVTFMRGAPGLDDLGGPSQA